MSLRRLRAVLGDALYLGILSRSEIDGLILAGQDRDDMPGDAVSFHRVSIVG